MIDNFALALSHGLMLLAAWRLISRPDLDDDLVGREGGSLRRWLRIRLKPEVVRDKSGIPRQWCGSNRLTRK